MRAYAAADLAAQKTLAASVTAASGAGGAWAWLSEAALTVLGVPLPVVLFAAFGAFGAGTFQPAKGLRPALLGGLGWMVVGIATAQLAAFYFGEVERPFPEKLLAPLALVIAGGLRLALPVVIKKRAEMIDRAANRYIGPKDNDDNNGGPRGPVD